METTRSASRILIVEDERLVAEDLRMRLERLGYVVVGLADTADFALALADEQKPDLVLLDIRLKGQRDGIDVAKRLRSDYLGFVYVTSNADRTTLARASETEPLGYVMKPFAEREIHAVIETALYRHRAEQRLRRMEKWQSMTLRSIGDAVVVTDDQQRIAFMNRSGEALTQWPLHRALGAQFQDVVRLVEGRERTPVRDLMARALTTGAEVHLPPDAYLVTADGTQVPVDDSVAPIRDDDGSITGVVVVLHDCTEKRALAEQQRQVEKRLQDAERLRSIGVLAGGLAHDFNNILTTILGNLALCRQEVGDTPGLTDTEASVQTAVKLCRQMMAGAGLGALDPQPVDLDAGVAECLAQIREAIPPAVAVQVHLAEPPPIALADRAQVQQVLDNLVRNAAEALGERTGTIVVSTGRAPVTAAELAAAVGAPQLPPGEYVFLEVQDDGPGMSEATSSRIFEPFFSTKFAGRGLGLAGVLGIVQRLGGAIMVRSTPGHGATFRVVLPPSRLPAPTPSPVARPMPEAAGGTILLVDDDPTVRRVTRRLLEREGYACIEAASGDEAVAMSAATTALSLLMLDLTMPGKRWRATLAEVRAHRPELPVLLVSGCLDPAESLPQQPGVAFLEKPYTPERLRLALGRLLRPNSA